MGLYAGGFKSEIDFALEPGWTYIWVGLYPEGGWDLFFLSCFWKYPLELVW